MGSPCCFILYHDPSAYLIGQCESGHTGEAGHWERGTECIIPTKVATALRCTVFCTEVGFLHLLAITLLNKDDIILSQLVLYFK